MDPRIYTLISVTYFAILTALLAVACLRGLKIIVRKIDSKGRS